MYIVYLYLLAYETSNDTITFVRMIKV